MNSHLDSDPDRTPAELLDIAVALAHSAGELLLRYRAAGRPATESKSTPTDVVTAADRAAEALICEGLARLRPADGILGEEGADTPGTSGIRWIVDPLDGTVNYLYDLGAWAVSIGAQRAGTSVAGVVFVPSTGQTFSATRGGGAFCDGRRLQIGEGPDLDRALVSTGFGYDARRRAHQVEVLRRVLPAIRDIRRHGACAVDLCTLAEGRIDAYYERGVNPWDWAAGGLIATEAGALIGGLHGNEPSHDLLLAAGPRLFGPLHDLLATAGAGHESGFIEPVTG
ncbi:MAG: inositol monophosphatase family protein [Sporichthyaceae bacterium]